MSILLKTIRRLLKPHRTSERTAPSGPARVALLVIADPALTGRVDRLLRQHGLDTIVVDSGSFALEIASRTEHLLVVAETPIADMNLSDFVSQLRARTGRRQGGLLVLTRTELRAEVQREIGGSATVLVRHAPDELLRTVLIRLVSAAPRKRPRGVVTARVVPDVPSSPLTCPVVNLSASGLLVATQRLLPVGTRCQIELTADSHGASFTTDGWVVRHQPPTGPSDSMYDRMAIQFLNGSATASDRLLRFLELV